MQYGIEKDESQLIASLMSSGIGLKVFLTPQGNRRGMRNE